MGFKDYKDEKPFDASMLVHFRKRLEKDFVCKVSEQINQKALKEAKAKSKKDDNDKGNGGAGHTGSNKQNIGKLLIDATCTPADITFPTDLKMLNEAREKSEQIIDELHRSHKGKKINPLTYRKMAR